MRGGQLLEVRIREARLRAHAGATKHLPGQGNPVDEPSETSARPVQPGGANRRPPKATGLCGQRKSARGLVAACDTARRQHDLPELVASRAEAARRGQQVVAPHPAEWLAVAA